MDLWESMFYGILDYLIMGLKKQGAEDLAKLIDLNDNDINFNYFQFNDMVIFKFEKNLKKPLTNLQK